MLMYIDLGGKHFDKCFYELFMKRDSSVVTFSSKGSNANYKNRFDRILIYAFSNNCRFNDYRFGVCRCGTGGCVRI